MHRCVWDWRKRSPEEYIFKWLYFITNYSNDDLFENAFGTSTHFVMKYLQSQLSAWRSKYRNGYFHKHNLEDKDKIDAIRDETFFLYLLILGTISLDADAMLMLS